MNLPFNTLVYIRRGGRNPTLLPLPDFSYLLFLGFSITAFIIQVITPHIADVTVPGLSLYYMTGSFSLNSGFILLDLVFPNFGSHCFLTCLNASVKDGPKSWHSILSHRNCRISALSANLTVPLKCAVFRVPTVHS